MKLNTEQAKALEAAKVLADEARLKLFDAQPTGYNGEADAIRALRLQADRLAQAIADLQMAMVNGTVP